jgi:hypothetical protein
MNVWLVDIIDMDEDSETYAICATEGRAIQAIEDRRKDYRMLFEKFPGLQEQERYAVYEVEVLE